MAASYKKLFKLLIDREMKSKELAALAKVSPATLAKMKKDGVSVNSDVLIKICTALGCTLDDIVEIVDDEKIIAKTQEEYFNYDRSCHVLYDKIKRMKKYTGEKRN